ncbi:Aste57867_4706 [Aphanomyces stellatus]|uniref:Aste57867_4706 protein n=1 Tax=Aphanomyces stellatus TaxID=120398 RepID=A0A485KDA9_9STRA|nr:hypothetical protein As57867_004693 [Aphanomyces stellatus]VFT81806.1 Aste57867_4706 [Aphanomyces stellatus]
MFWSNPSALSQVLIVASVCFCCPGLFNALSSIAAGVNDETINYNATAVLYACFAMFGLFAGGIVNVIGPKITLFIGTWGYVIYASSLLVMDKDFNVDTKLYSTSATNYYYAANAILGIGAGLLWTAQGQMCMAYPTSETKGTFFSYFWIIFNLGATLGGFLTFGTNYNTTGNMASTATYIVFLVLMSCGALLSLALADPNTVVRNDGTMVTVERLPNPITEIGETFKLFFDPKMLLLFPLFAYSNWFYNYHFFFNQAFFNKRTQGFNSAFYWGSQMLGAYLVGKFLDRPGQKKTKALFSILLLALLIVFMWAAALWIQLSFDLDFGDKRRTIDFHDSEWFLKFLLFAYFGFNDAICQVWSYWLMGQYSDDMATLGRYAGYYKCVQSGMAAVAWRLGGIPLTPTAVIGTNIGLSAVGLICAYISVKFYLEDDKPAGYDGIETPVNHKSLAMAH